MPAGKRKSVAKKNSPPVEIEALGVEAGVDTNLAFTTPFSPVGVGTRRAPDEELHEVMREEYENEGPTVRQLVTMRRMDGQARALFRLLTLPIKSALKTSSFVPAEGGEEEAEFMEQVIALGPENGGMTVTWNRFVSQLLSALFDGFSAFEKVYWIPIRGPLAGKITLKKLAHRPSETITFVADKRGGFAGFRQRAQNGGKVTDIYIPPEYCFYYAAQEEERKFYGVSFFQSAFYHYDKKVKLYFTAHLAAQRAAVGTRVGTVPPNASSGAKTEFKTQLQNLAFAQFMMMPEGFKVEILREGGNFDFLNVINHHNNQMSKSILAGFFDKETGAGKGEGSLVNFAQPGDDMFILMLRAVMDEIASQINHYIIPQLIDLNFKDGKYPEFTWGKLTDEQKAAISATFDKLASERTVTPEFMRSLEEHVAEEFGLDVDYEEVEEREAQEASMASEGFGPDGQPLNPGMGTPMGPDGMPLDGGQPGAGAPQPAQLGAGAPPGGQPPTAVPGADGAPAEDPNSWQSLDDFEAALASSTESSPQNGSWSDSEEDSDDEDEVTLTEVYPSKLLALAQGLLDAAMEEEMLVHG